MATKRQMDKNELIQVTNITNGTVIYVSKKTGAEYLLEGYGSTEMIELGELITMKASANKILTEPWLRIDDENAVEFLGLKSIYEKANLFEDVNKFFSKSLKEMEKNLEKAPSGYKSLVASKAKEMIDNKELDSIKKIELIENILKVNLRD